MIERWLPASVDDQVAAAARCDADVLNQIGTKAADDGKLEDAVDALTAAVVAGGGWAAANLGRALSRLKRYEAAALAYMYATENGIAEARVSLGAILSDELDRKEEAEAEFLAAAAEGNSTAILNLGLLYKEVGRMDEAVSYLRRASEQGEGFASEKLGMMLEERGAARDAWEPLFRLSAEQGEADALVTLAQLLAKHQEPTAAEQAFSEAVALGAPDAVNSYGCWLVEQQGREDEAEQLYRDALGRGDLSVFRNLANILSVRSETSDEALACYAAAIATGDRGACRPAAEFFRERGQLQIAAVLEAQFEPDE